MSEIHGERGRSIEKGIAVAVGVLSDVLPSCRVRKSMLDRLLKLLTAPEPQPEGYDDLQIAVAVLLVEAARMDSTFDQKERATIERLLAERFSLSAEATQRLITLAESKAERSNQLYPFTRLAVERMDYGHRTRLIEMLWEVAYADGVLDADEDALLRRVAGLIYVSDQDRGAARQRVLARMGGQVKEAEE